MTVWGCIDISQAIADDWGAGEAYSVRCCKKISILQCDLEDVADFSTCFSVELIHDR